MGGAKGRKQRCTPLTTQTVDVLRVWMRELGGPPDAPLFPSRRGTALSTDAVEALVDKYAAAARRRCPSLATKTVTPPHPPAQLRHATPRLQGRQLSDRPLARA